MQHVNLFTCLQEFQQLGLGCGFLSFHDDEGLEG